jgi:outer membrane murein-binding lipoprotein Lpp
MKSTQFLLAAAASGLLLAGVGLASTAGAAQTQTQVQATIYGSQLMTPQERNAYRNKMRETKTAQEREKLRIEHHEQMQERAKQRGITLPDAPPEKGMRKGMGPGGGMVQGGSGMGPGGGGMGTGGGKP